MVIEYKIKFEGNAVVVTQSTDSESQNPAPQGSPSPNPQVPHADGLTSPPDTGERILVQPNSCGLTIVFGQTVITQTPPQPGGPVERPKK
jgi:hypothetical protein